MKLYMQFTKTDSYNHETLHRKPVGCDRALELLRGPDTSVVASTWVYNARYIPGFRDPHAVLVLDCDSQENYAAAKHYIAKFLKFRTCDVESSPGHYWVICDFVASIKKVLERLKEIPGVDGNYVRMAAKARKLFLRACPQTGLRPVFMDDDEKLSNPHAAMWFKSFKKFHLCDEMGDVIYAAMLREAVQNNTVATLMADPDFVV